MIQLNHRMGKICRSNITSTSITITGMDDKHICIKIIYDNFYWVKFLLPLDEWTCISLNLK